MFIGITGVSPDSLSHNFIDKQESEYGIYKVTGDDRLNFTIMGHYYKGESEGVGIIHKDSLVITHVGKKSSKKYSYYFKEW